MKSLRTLFIILIIIGFSTGLSHRSWAVPSLQLYIDGATYDEITETWVYPGLEYDLWAIGADKDYGVIIENVTMSAAVKPDQSGSILIQPILDENGTLGDALPWIFFENSIPVKGDGKKLPKHDVYPNDYYKFALGDFVLDEQGISDFSQDYDPDNPTTSNAWGKIMKYHVTVSGGFDWVHFDLYDHIDGENHALFAPFSHDADAEDGGPPVPEPSTMILLGSGLLGIAGFRRKLRIK